MDKNNKTQYILAIDLGGTSVKCGIANSQTLKIIHQFCIEALKGDEVIPSIFAAFNKELIKLKINYEKDIIAVGLGAKGPYDKEKGVVMNAGDIGWFNYPVMEVAKRIFKKPFFLTNDSRAACIGEWKKGKGRNYRNFLVLTLGQGIGSGLILDNKLWLGSHNVSGELGHSGFFQTDRECGCGLPYCMEAISSARGMEFTIDQFACKFEDSPIGLLKSQLGRRLSVKDAAPIICKNDFVIQRAMRKCLKPLAERISLISYLMDLERVFIGGGPSQLGEILIEHINYWRKQIEWDGKFKQLKVEICELKENAGLVGVVEYAAGKMNESLIEFPN